MTVRLLICVFALTLANPNDQTKLERTLDKIKQYQLNVPERDPITIIDTTSPMEDPRDKWEEISIDFHREFHDEDKNQRPRCFGPSCQEGFVEEEGPQGNIEENFQVSTEHLRDYRDLSKDRLQAISDLAAKLKRNKYKNDRVSLASLEQEAETDDVPEDDSRKVMTSWNRLKVKQHKHPYDDKDGWITLEPVAWSTSKVSKWKPNKKVKPSTYWNNEEEQFSDEEKFSSPVTVSSGDSYTYPQKRPVVTRPGYINNKLHVPVEYEVEMPSRPSWNNRPQQSMYTYPGTWSPDEGRRPHKPHCDSEENGSNDDTVFYGLSDSLVTDSRPPNFPYEYEALHQAASQKRPIKRPTQVVYAGSPDIDNDRASKPHHGDGQWVLLSTTKGYRNKKRQRSLNPEENDQVDFAPIVSHQAVALTVLPVDDAHTNMTTSHGGLLEVEKSFQTVEESKLETDKKNDLMTSSNQNRPVVTKVIKRKVLGHGAPDSSTVLAAVGAGIVPATMAMVVPMMLGRKRRRRDIGQAPDEVNLDYMLKY